MNSYESLKDVRITKSLLGWGILAGPFYVVAGAAEMTMRQGFDPLRHSLSLMSNGEFGWVHITMMILTGLFTMTAAVGFFRSRYLGIGAGWAPYLLGLYGLGLVGAGIFTADPARGFPIGTPADANDISWHGLLHFICGGIGFLGLIGACFSFARTFARMDEKASNDYPVIDMEPSTMQMPASAVIAPFLRARLLVYPNVFAEPK